MTYFVNPCCNIKKNIWFKSTHYWVLLSVFPAEISPIMILKWCLGMALRLVKKLLHFSFLEFVCFLSESRHPPTPASAASLPPYIQASQAAVQYGKTHRLELASSSYAGRSGGSGRPIPAGTLELPAAHTSVRGDVQRKSYYSAM